MPHDPVTNWLICYDIADPDRLGKIHRIVSKIGIMVQYSVYYLRAGESELDDLLAILNKKIRHKEDDIRIYPIPDNPNATEKGHDIIAKAILRAGVNDALVLGEENITSDSASDSAKGACNILKRQPNMEQSVENETRKKGD